MNRLGSEQSPYLRQHAEDPVDWYPFGDGAFAAAKDLDRPLFLSIGYSACHWCHVMGHESFADPDTAALMNRLVVSVKVDREERPDVDSIYMEAVQAQTGRGGWPMSVFATPEGLPFLAGTYFPDSPRHGMPAFSAVLEAVGEAWRDRRPELVSQAGALAHAITARLEPPAPIVGHEDLPQSATRLRRVAVERLAAMFDERDGGFGSAPKFPQPLLLDLLVVDVARDPTRGGPTAARSGPTATRTGPLAIAKRTLRAMASGGIYDQLGGGFARYSVDDHWLVPHFEKMLYDQALLARVYLHAWQLTGESSWRQVLTETLDYVLRDLRDPQGGLFSAEDADSEGEEGRFYLWDRAELTEVLGPELGERAARYFGVTPGGNYEGRSILHRSSTAVLDSLSPEEVDRARAALLAARSLRIRPGLDDKIVTEWNALAVSSLAEAAAATGNTKWASAAVQVAEFLLANLRRDDGRVLRSWCRGSATVLGYAADYAALVDCCTRLGELTGEARWFETALVLARDLLARFVDERTGGLFTTGADAPALLVRPRDLYDGVTPAAGSVAVVALARLGAIVGDPDLVEAAARIAKSARGALELAPSGFPELLVGLDLLEAGTVEIVVTGNRPDLLAASRERFVPQAVRVHGKVAERETTVVGAMFSGKQDGYVYLCRRGTCLSPIGEARAVSDALDDLVRTP